MNGTVADSRQIEAEKRVLHGLHVSATRTRVGSEEWQHIQDRIEVARRNLSKLIGGRGAVASSVTQLFGDADREYRDASKEIPFGSLAWNYWSPWTPSWMEMTGVENELAAENKYIETVKHGLAAIETGNAYLGELNAARDRIVKGLTETDELVTEENADEFVRTHFPEDAWAGESDPLQAWMKRHAPGAAAEMAQHTRHAAELSGTRSAVIQTRYRKILEDYLDGIEPQRLMGLSGLNSSIMLNEWDSLSSEAKDMILAGASGPKGETVEVKPAGVFDLLRTLMGKYPLGTRRFENLGAGMTAFLHDTLRGRTPRAIPDKFNLERGSAAILRAMAMATESPEILVARAFGPATSIFWAVIMPEWALLEWLVGLLIQEGVALWTGKPVTTTELLAMGQIGAGDRAPMAHAWDVPFVGIEALRAPKLIATALRDLERGSQYSKAMQRIWETQGDALRAFDRAPFYLRDELRLAAVAQLRKQGEGILAAWKGSAVDKKAFGDALNQSILSMSIGMSAKLRTETWNRMDAVLGHLEEYIAIPHPEELENLRTVLRMWDAAVLEKFDAASATRSAALKALPAVPARFRTAWWTAMTRWAAPAEEAVEVVERRTVRGSAEDFNLVLLSESIGGNAGPMGRAVNASFDEFGKITEFGNRVAPDRKAIAGFRVVTRIEPGKSMATAEQINQITEIIWYEKPSMAAFVEAKRFQETWNQAQRAANPTAAKLLVGAR